MGSHRSQGQIRRNRGSCSAAGTWGLIYQCVAGGAKWPSCTEWQHAPALSHQSDERPSSRRRVSGRIRERRLKPVASSFPRGQGGHQESEGSGHSLCEGARSNAGTNPSDRENSVRCRISSSSEAIAWPQRSIGSSANERSHNENHREIDDEFLDAINETPGWSVSHSQRWPRPKIYELTGQQDLLLYVKLRSQGEGFWGLGSSIVANLNLSSIPWGAVLLRQLAHPWLPDISV